MFVPLPNQENRTMKTKQKPILSKFNAKSTADEVAAGHDLVGKIAIVTGGNSGIGYETVRTLATHGAGVIVGARDAGKAADRLTQLKNVSFIPLDLADPASVDAFAKQFLKDHQTLNLLINNAGVWQIPELRKDGRGYELTFGVNHLGHFQLTGRLFPALKKAAGARVVNVSSIGHRHSALDLADINFEKQPYDKAKAYGQSKSAVILFAVELDRIGREHNVRAFAVHPGAILTDIFRYMSEEERQAWIKRTGSILKDGFKNEAQGAATSVWCALSDDLRGKGGVYCEDCNIAELVPDDSPAGYGVRTHAVDPTKAAALWQFSETVTGVSLT